MPGMNRGEGGRGDRRNRRNRTSSPRSEKQIQFHHGDAETRRTAKDPEGKNLPLINADGTDRERVD